MSRELILLICAAYFISIPYVQSANILGIFPCRSPSHFRVFSPFLEELALRGHNVDVLSAFPRKTPLERYTDFSLKESLTNVGNVDPNAVFRSVWDDMNIALQSHGHDMCSAVMNATISQELKQSTKKYDVLISQLFFSPCMIGYAQLFKIPIILISSTSSLPWMDDILGIPSNPSYIPNIFSAYNENMNFVQRLHNLYMLVITKFWYNYFASDISNKYYKDFFGDDVVHLNDLVKQSSLIMVNSHFTVHQSRPVTPDFIEIAGIHIQRNTTLPEDFHQNLETDLRGVIYLSFGTYLHTESFSEDKIRTLLEVLGKLPYKILWKADRSKFPNHLNIPSNIEFKPWMPQVALLCNPKINLFISHGGLASTLESIHCGKKVFVIPVWADQHANGNIVATKGIGKTLPLSELSKERLSEELDDILQNPKYDKNVKQLSRRFHDRPMSPMDTAVYWTEYVIRHKGAAHLRTKAADLPWYTYYCIDIIVVPSLVVVIVLTFLYKLFVTIFNLKGMKMKIE